MKKQQTQKDELSPAQYWEWRHATQAAWLAQQKQANANLLLLNIKLKGDLETLKQQVNIEKCTKAVEDAQGDYRALIQRIETDLGQSLKGKLINDHTFQITDAPAEKDSV